MTEQQPPPVDDDLPEDDSTSAELPQHPMTAEDAEALISKEIG